MYAANAFGMPSSGWIDATRSMRTEAGVGYTCAVRLVDRRTGAAHRINGAALTIFTRNPEDAAVELLAGRDPAVWEVRVERLEARTRR